MLTRRSFVRASAASLATPALLHDVSAQTSYPTAPIHSICMSQPGGGADVIVRHYANMLSQRAGKPVIVENKPGAFGNLATETVVRAKPDGYTICIAPGSSVLAAAPHLFKKLPFDPVNDLEHVTTLMKLAFILLVSADSPFNSVADLTKYLKERGTKASYGSAANTALVGSELYKAAFGLETQEVKYKDSSVMLSDLTSGQLAFVHLDPISSAGYRESGKVRALAMTSAKRLEALPDIPGAEEVGIHGSDLIAWWSVHAPAKTPKPILVQLETWFNEIAVHNDTKKFLLLTGSDPFPGNSQMLKDLLVADTKAWGDYVKLAKIEPIG